MGAKGEEICALPKAHGAFRGGFAEFGEVSRHLRLAGNHAIVLVFHSFRHASKMRREKNRLEARSRFCAMIVSSAGGSGSPDCKKSCQGYVPLIS